MLEVDQVRDCKRLHAKGMGIRAIARELEVSRNTVRAYLRGERMPGEYRMEHRRDQPVRDKIRARVRELLKDEKREETPRKQRLTAARMFRLLRDEGSSASESIVRRVAQEVRLDLRDPLRHAYLTLEYEPGRDAQVDFFEGEVNDRHSGRQKVHILLVRACFSRRTFAYAAPNQTREALLEVLMQSFEFFGGVFDTLWFDNLTPAVKKVLKGRALELQKAFQCFEAHYGFRAEFCAPGKGNEKGGVESEVKYSRHEILSPIPTVDGREGLQELCDAWMSRDVDRQVRGTEHSIGDLWRLEEDKLGALPACRFQAGREYETRVSPRSWIANATNHYSAPVEWVGHDVTVRLEAEEVVIIHRTDPPVRHRRCYGRHQMMLVLDHYLPLLRRKSRGLDRCLPFRRWIETVSPCWSRFLGVLRRCHGEVRGSRDFVDTLLLCRHWGEKAVAKAIDRTLSRPEVSLASLRYDLRHQMESERPPAPTLRYDGPQVAAADTAAYMALCEEGQS